MDENFFDELAYHDDCLQKVEREVEDLFEASDIKQVLLEKREARQKL